MKVLSLLFVIVLHQSAQAIDPVELCDQNPNCSSSMNQIIESFKQGDDEFLDLPISAFSGVCFHANAQYDSSTAHHGAFSFERKGLAVNARGIFSFFNSQNPFANLTTQELIEYLKKSDPHSSKLSSLKDPVTLEFKSEDSEITYWFRSLDENEKLLLIGLHQQGTIYNLVTCEMQRNH